MLTFDILVVYNKNKQYNPEQFFCRTFYGDVIFDGKSYQNGFS